MDELYDMTFEEITQAAANNRLGHRGTPVLSFWPMKDKWKAFGDYWELWGTDGDETVEMIDGQQLCFSPAILRLLYFKLSVSEIVCQVAYIWAPKQPATMKSRTQIAQNIRENMEFAISKKHPKVEGVLKEMVS